MILILDTNAIRMLNPNGSDADVLRIIKTSGTARIAVPEMVLHEMVAQQVIEYRDAYQKADNAVRRLRGRHPKSIPAFIGSNREPDFEAVREEWERQYKAILDLIPTTGEIALRSLIREANGEKPAKVVEKQGEKKKEGARDVAIWLSVINYMRENPHEHIYFVTKNSKDFGNGAEWPPPMDSDLHGMTDRITLLPDMDAVVSAFTEIVQAAELSTDASSALEGLSSTIGELAIKLMRGGHGRLRASALSRFDRSGQFKRITFRRWVAPPDAELLRVTNVTGHRIGDNVWFIADVEWLLWGVSQALIPSLGVTPVACIWETRVLMTTSGGERPTIVSDRPIVRHLSPEDRDRWAPVLERAFGPLDELIAGEGQNLTEKQLLGYSEENEHLLRFIPTSVIDDENAD
ncbi:PIN domain-containing protein [Streptomyces sp. BE230]|uniref:PIN domain-containing protein n=1 Tax=Streptomyces sp. BE230 TaxID=3002526 RepID=UPI002ED1557B|nr:PIN domain-containing protein [Streptomyces sp. BE230]